MTHAMPVPAGDQPVDEAAFAEYAARGAHWNGARLLLGITAMAFGGCIFAYFYLRSVDSLDMWRLVGQRPPPLLGAVATACAVAGAVIFTSMSRSLRRRADAGNDWRVGALTSLLLMVAAAGLQIWELTRLSFYPGSSGFASVFVATTPLLIVWLLGAAYWIETLLARSIRLPGVLVPSATEGPLREGSAFRSSLDACVYLLGVLAILSLLFYVLFYWLP